MYHTTGYSPVSTYATDSYIQLLGDKNRAAILVSTSSTGRRVAPLTRSICRLRRRRQFSTFRQRQLHLIANVRFQCSRPPTQTLRIVPVVGNILVMQNLADVINLSCV